MGRAPATPGHLILGDAAAAMGGGTAGGGAATSAPATAPAVVLLGAIVLASDGGGPPFSSSPPRCLSLRAESADEELELDDDRRHRRRGRGRSVSIMTEWLLCRRWCCFGVADATKDADDRMSATSARSAASSEDCAATVCNSRLICDCCSRRTLSSASDRVDSMDDRSASGESSIDSLCGSCTSPSARGWWGEVLSMSAVRMMDV